MNKYLFALSVPLLSINMAQADDGLYSPRPDWVQPIAEIPEFGKQGHHYDQQYLLVDRQLDLTQPIPVEYKRYTSKIVSIEGVESASQLSIDFDPSYQSVNVHRLEIIRNGKTIDRKTSAKTSQFKREVDLDSLLYNGEETLHIVLDDVRVGDIIDFSYSISGFNPVFGEHREWYIKTGWATSVALVNTRIRMPKDSDFHVTNLEGKGNGKAKEITENGARIFTYQERNGLYDFDESEQPRWFNPYPYLHVSSYQNWQDVVEWALPLYAAPDKDDEVQALVADIQDTYPDDKEKQIVAAIHFVQNNIRYLGIENGIGSHKPRPPAQIISQGYGDCKDKSLLLVSMLNELGVEAYPALVDTFWKDQLKDQPAAPYSFNHVIVRMTYDGKPWWIDATRTHQGSRLDSIAQSRLGYALVIKPETNALSEMAPPTIPVTQDVEQKYVVNHAHAQSYLTVKTTYRGLEAERWRRYLESKPLVELGEEYANYYASFFNALDLMRPLTISDDLETNEVTVNEAYVIEGLWSKSEDAYTFVVSGDIVDDYLTKPDLIRRKTPFRFGTEGAVRQKIKLSLPESWEIEASNHTINGPYFEFQSSLSKISAPGETLFDKTYVEANYFYRSKKRHVEASELRQYLGDIDDAWNSVDYEFTYRP